MEGEDAQEAVEGVDDEKDGAQDEIGAGEEGLNQETGEHIIIW